MRKNQVNYLFILSLMGLGGFHSSQVFADETTTLQAPPPVGQSGPMVEPNGQKGFVDDHYVPPAAKPKSTGLKFQPQPGYHNLKVKEPPVEIPVKLSPGTNDGNRFLDEPRIHVIPNAPKPDGQPVGNKPVFGGPGHHTLKVKFNPALPQSTQYIPGYKPNNDTLLLMGVAILAVTGAGEVVGVVGGISAGLVAAAQWTVATVSAASPALVPVTAGLMAVLAGTQVNTENRTRDALARKGVTDIRVISSETDERGVLTSGVASINGQEVSYRKTSTGVKATSEGTTVTCATNGVCKTQTSPKQ